MTTADLTQDYFSLFGLQQSYDLDLADLSQRYRNLQNTVHPDKFASASAQERRLSVQQSALINEAYQTLRNPLNRANYMLQLRGIDLSGDTGASMDSEFLMQQMQLREELEQVRSTADATKLLSVAHEIEQAIDAYTTSISELFAKDEESGLEQISDYVRRMQFLVKLRQEVDALEEQMD
ncbi:MAG: Fe-S protein assembly co-chaperone HscB [Gammaproteobacteria bacterium]|jgi:molecular chaperone HscB